MAEGEPVEHPMVPWFEKFDEGPYSKDEGQVMVTVPIGESMSVSTQAQVVAIGYDIAPLAQRSVLNTKLIVVPSKDQQFGTTMSFVFRTESEEHTSELQSHLNLVCRLLLDK